ncbi:MAG: hypothetical protein ACJ79K_05445 [Gemmatimonadaceae bacterium]
MADQQQGSGRPTGAGSEASEGIHGARGERGEGDKTSVTEDRSAADRKKGSEPLDQDRKNEHRSGYGGSGGAPVTSSDQREDENRGRKP